MELRCNPAENRLIWMERFDLHRLACKLMAEHGNDAVIAAVLMADGEMDHGNTKGFRDWHEVAKLIRRLQGETIET